MENAETQLRAAENKVAELQAQIEAFDAALRGERVSDFMASFPLVRRAMDLYVQAHPTFVSDGEYTEATVFFGDEQAKGLSRSPTKALAYALEEMAAKMRRSA